MRVFEFLRIDFYSRPDRLSTQDHEPTPRDVEENFSPKMELPSEYVPKKHSIGYSSLTMESIHFARTASPAGPLLLALSSKGLLKLEFDRGQRTEGNGQSWQDSSRALQPWLTQLKEYFEGRRRDFSLPLDLRGTDFQVKCWNALLDIPYGATSSYRDIARAIGHPQAFRAVGMSNNRNPIAIVVPCHRVIASDGTLCGYGGGLDIKRKLLDLEHAAFAPGLPLAIGA
jgi:methylated-DNA-[protein]-cysteine S-methyltransferase